ncbi:hypothetical protein K1T35_48455 (plasmid) [Pseudonocardia sp. DSM 110487]|uniref:hypothetical protein n=1 Tax=Pseudonocardia sp. DSM 110487 TaxID=2865833 RepID=UPI001C6A517F|nr:hypothetical protein [Pseudonocardia sp. DSM 110487]QYN41181.1 hypothetical protein K1T35_48455 [Pseudonocardia sp. DSM 110487]
MPEAYRIAEPRQLMPGAIDDLTVRAADHLLDHLLATDPDSHPDDPTAAIDAAQLAEMRHRYAINRHGVSRIWNQLTNGERGGAAIETWGWLNAACHQGERAR